MKNLSVMLWTAVSAFCDTTTYLFTLYRREKKGLGCMQFSQKLRLFTLSVLVHISTAMNKAIQLYHLNDNYSTSAKYLPWPCAVVSPMQWLLFCHPSTSAIVGYIMVSSMQQLPFCHPFTSAIVGYIFTLWQTTFHQYMKGKKWLHYHIMTDRLLSTSALKGENGYTITLWQTVYFPPAHERELGLAYDAGFCAFSVFGSSVWSDLPPPLGQRASLDS